MRRLILLFLSLLLFTLSACDQDDGLFDYSDFSDIAIESNSEAEGKSTDKYIVYYYQESCSHCIAVKQDILSFANDFEALDFYIFDISKAVDSTSLEEFVGTPTVFIFSGEEIIESYIGKNPVLEFINIYKDIVLTYDSFTDQQLTTYNEILEIQSDRYLVYYYLETCPNCIDIKETVLNWAFTKNVNDIFIMNGASVVDPDNFPTELQILTSGTPLLIVMNNGVVTDEYYLGKEEILAFIELDTE